MNQANSQAKVFPPLRTELKLLSETQDAAGNKEWLLYDPVRHRYYQISELYFSILYHWGKREPEKIAEAVNQSSSLKVDETDVEECFEFLNKNQMLSRNNIPNPKQNPLKSLTKLFFIRFPMVSPQPVLNWILGFKGMVNLRLIVYALFGMFLLGLFLVSRQWEQFSNTFSYLYEWNGIILLILGVLLSKLFHEFGHGLIARYFGCRVGVCGVALMFGYPMFYIDISDGWRIRSGRQRALISAGGIIGESILMVIALWLWLLLPDGPFRTIAHAMVAVTFVATLLINLNPFMRFDGYFLISDILNTPNLQEKSFAMGKWNIRRLLLGWNEPAPVKASKAFSRFLVVFAYCVWVWRFLIFAGIAWIAFQFVVKVLGILLMVNALVNLVMLPVYKEFKYYYEHRGMYTVSRRRYTVWAVLVVLLVYLLVPMPHRLNLPAVLQSSENYQVLTPQSARLAFFSLAEGDAVEAGQLLAELEDENVTNQLKLEKIRLQATEKELSVLYASPDDLGQIRVLEQKRLNHIARIESLESIVDNLRIYSPISGYIHNIPLGVTEGIWLEGSSLLGSVASQNDIRVWSVILERDWSLVKPGNRGRFFPENSLWQDLEVEVSLVEDSPVLDLAVPYQMSIYGGQIPVFQTQNGQVTTADSIYRIEMSVLDEQAIQLKHVLRGTVVVGSEPYSIALRWWQRLVALFIRETGF